MNPVESELINTRKSVLEVCEDLGYNNISEVEIHLEQCSSCGLWQTKLIPDLDGNGICKYCYASYGL